MTNEFDIMMNKAYQILEAKETSSNTIFTLPPLVIDIDTTRLHWKNIKEILKFIDRDPEHFMTFLKSEMPGKEVNWFSSSKSDGLIIHGKKQNKAYIESLTLKYVEAFVICPGCKKPETQMLKIKSKLYEFECLVCGLKKNI